MSDFSASKSYILRNYKLKSVIDLDFVQHAVFGNQSLLYEISRHTSEIFSKQTHERSSLDDRFVKWLLKIALITPNTHLLIDLRHC
jgi:hypothetical protein